MRAAAVVIIAGLAAVLLAWTFGWFAREPADRARDSIASRDHLLRGLDLARQGLHERAVEEFRAYLSTVPDDPNAHFHLGRSLLEMASRLRVPPSEAIAALEEALRLNPELDAARLQLAQVYGTRIPGTFVPQRAIELYEQLIRKSPDRFDFRLEFAQWLDSAEVRMQRESDGVRVTQDSAWAMDLARFHLEKTIDNAPPASSTAIDAWALLSEVQFRSGEWDAARAILLNLIENFSDRTKYSPAWNWNTVGHCLYRLGDYRAAAEAFRKAYDLTADVVFQYDLYLAHQMIGDYPDDLPKHYRFPMREENITTGDEPFLAFEDIAPRLRINKYAGAGPCGWGDYNSDGRYDLVVCGCDTFCTLYRAEGDRFVDATMDAGLARLEPGFGAAWADYNNDGHPDLYIARNGWNGAAPNSLLRNNGDGTFTDAAAEAGVGDPGSSFHSAWFDYDRDGWLDLVVSNGVYLDGSTNQLYRNEGDGTFRNVTVTAGLSEPVGWGTIGVAVGDYDDDGWPDVFFHARDGPNRLYRNKGDGTFTDVAAEAGVSGSGDQNGYIALMADMDSDGDLDIFTGSLAQWEHVVAGYQSDYRPGPLRDIPRLYRNNGDGTFIDASLKVGFRYPLGIMAAGVGDLDNDGYLDVYLGTGDPDLRRLEPNILYHNRKGESFENVTRFAGLGRLGKGHGITFIDWDEDGDLDVFAQLGGFYHGDLWESAFFLNKAGNRNHWLAVRLRQFEKNRDAVGARVTVRAGPRAQVQEVTAGRGFSSTDPPILHFGLGSSTQADRVEIRWPDGTRQVLERVAADQTLRVNHPALEATAVHR